jgi:hypothetical protein
MTGLQHHVPPAERKFSVGVADGKMLVGVAMVGRPLARAYDDRRGGGMTRRELPRWAAIAVQRLGEFHRAGWRITAVRLNADQRADLAEFTGQAERVFGFPVREGRL